MQIIKKRLKNALSNKILTNQLTPYNIFYVIIDSSQTININFRKKILTKLLFKKNFNLLKESSFNYPICYLSTNTIGNLFKMYSDLKKHIDFKKIIICNFKIKFLLFKNIQNIQNYHLENSSLIFYKLYILMNPLMLSITLPKNIKLLNNK